MENKKFELCDDALDNVAGGMNADNVQSEPTAQALSRGMSLNMTYRVKEHWLNCDCGSDTYRVTSFLSDDTGFETECVTCKALGCVSYEVYDLYMR